MSEKEIIGKCPECGGDVVESAKGYGCSNWKEENGGCKFVIWKNLCGKTLSKVVAKSLLEKGSTSKIKGFVSQKTSKEFEASLKLEKTDEGTKVIFDFN